MIQRCASRYIKAMLLITLVAGFLAAQDNGTSATAILELDREVDRAILEKNVGFLGQKLASSFRFTHGDGKSQSKSQFIEAVRLGRMSAKTREVADQDVETHGDVFIVTGQVHVMRDDPDPTRRDYRIWYMRVYRNRDNHLELLSHRTVKSTLIR